MWLNDAWAYRHPIAIYRVGTGTEIDANVAIPAWWDDFWAAVDADGDDIRITGPDGVTELGFQLDGWNSTTRVGTIQIEDFPTPDAGASTGRLYLGWVYWGNAGAAAVTPSGHTPSTPSTGYIHLGVPGPDVVEARRLIPGDTRPPPHPRSSPSCHHCPTPSLLSTTEETL